MAECFLSEAVESGPRAVCFLSLSVCFELLSLCMESLAVVHGPLAVCFLALPDLYLRLATCGVVWALARRCVSRASQFPAIVRVAQPTPEEAPL